MRKTCWFQALEREALIGRLMELQQEERLRQSAGAFIGGGGFCPGLFVLWRSGQAFPARTFSFSLSRFSSSR
jgi:hypothetical protein